MYNFEIDSSLFPLFKEKITSLNNRAEKHGLPLVEYNASSPYSQHIVGLAYKEMRLITVLGEEFKINGWEVIARLDHRSPGVLVTMFSESDAVKWQYNSCNCEHCNVKRSRNFTYVLFNPETKAIKQVGKTCLKDFTGHSSPEAIIKWLETAKDEIVELVNRTTIKTADAHLVNVDKFLASVFAQVENHGTLVTKREMMEGADVGSMNRDTATFVVNNEIEYTQKHIDMVAEAKKFVANRAAHHNANEFSTNLHTLCKCENVAMAHIHVLVHAARGYLQHVERENKKAEPTGLNEYVGGIGDRMNLELTLTRCHEYVSDDFTSYTHNFLDKEGRTYTWRTSHRVCDDGETVKLRGTVKAHTEFRQVKQTVLTRCRVE